MRSLLAAGLTAALLASTPFPGLAASKSFDVEPFTAVEISSGLNAVVSVGGDLTVSAESGRQDSLDELMIEVENGTLRAWTDWNLFDLLDFGNEGQTTITITVPELTGATANSGADVDITGMTGDRLSLDASSGASVDARQLAGGRVTAEASSGARLQAAGECDEMTAEASSGALVDVRSVVCEAATAEASSGAHADVHATRAVEAEASSGGGVTVFGKPGETRVDSSSGGNVVFAD